MAPGSARRGGAADDCADEPGRVQRQLEHALRPGARHRSLRPRTEARAGPNVSFRRAASSAASCIVAVARARRSRESRGRSAQPRRRRHLPARTRRAMRRAGKYPGSATASPPSRRRTPSSETTMIAQNGQRRSFGGTIADRPRPSARRLPIVWDADGFEPEGRADEVTAQRRAARGSSPRQGATR